MSGGNGTNKMKIYQITKTRILDAKRYQKSKSIMGEWWRKNYENKFVVSTSPVDVDGNFDTETLKNRGYAYTGAGSDALERKIAFGEKKWFRAFETEAEAEDEVTALTETGI